MNKVLQALLLTLALAVVAGISSQLPDIQRYLKIRSM